MKVKLNSEPRQVPVESKLSIQLDVTRVKRLLQSKKRGHITDQSFTELQLVKYDILMKASLESAIQPPSVHPVSLY